MPQLQNFIFFLGNLKYLYHLMDRLRYSIENLTDFHNNLYFFNQKNRMGKMFASKLACEWYNGSSI